LPLILDTHYAYFLADRPSALSQREQDVVLDADAELLISAVSFWELRLKWSRFHVSGDRKGPISPQTAYAVLRDLGLGFLDLTPAQTVHTLDPPLDHTDPFDELLLSQAQHEDMKLFTRDVQLADHPLAYSV
jgi:PIN domain nuclease of toxin-antitoxin system